MTANTENKHSKGPWSFQRCQSDLALYQLLDSTQRVIGFPRHGTGGIEDREEFEANARLIAASPSMYGYISRMADQGDSEAKSIMEAIHGNA
jgi:hypothetical protein